MNAKTFLIRLITLIFLGCLTVYIFIMFVDPYQINGLNLVNKHGGGSSDRISKPVILEKMGDDFKMFILGGSRAGNFKPLMVEQISRQKTYNYSLVNGSLEDYIAAVNHIVHVQNPKIIYLQLDFYTFNETHSTRNTILNTPLEKYLSQYIDLKRGTNSYDVPIFFDTTYFSLAAFIDSYKSVKLYLKNRNKDVSPTNTPTQTQKVTLHNDETLSSRDAKNKKVVFTTAGFTNAETIVRRHRLAERLVVDLFGVELYRAHTEAHLLEHAISPYLETKILAKLGNPSISPYGYPIPGSGYVINKNALKLSKSPINANFIVDRIPVDDQSLLKYLVENNVTPGQTGSISEINESAGTISINCSESEAVFSLSVGDLIWVIPN